MTLGVNPTHITTVLCQDFIKGRVFLISAHTPSPAHTHPHLHTPSPAHTLTCTHPYLHTPSPAHTLTCTHPHLHTPSPAHTLTCTHPHLHTAILFIQLKNLTILSSNQQLSLEHVKYTRVILIVLTEQTWYLKHHVGKQQSVLQGERKPSQCCVCPAQQASKESEEATSIELVTFKTHKYKHLGKP